LAVHLLRIPAGGYYVFPFFFVVFADVVSLSVFCSETIQRAYQAPTFMQLMTGE
jgi:hypothetical protein